MAKKPEPPHKSSRKNHHHQNNNNSNNKTKTQKKNKNLTSNSTKAKTKIENSAVDDEPQLLVASSSEEDDELNETNGDGNEEKETLRSIKKKRRAKRELKDKSKSKDEGDDEDALYRFPMNRISRIIKSENNNHMNNNSDLKIAHEAVFLINRASEKFLELLSKEAYACAYLDLKHHVSYDHMSSVVSKRSRLSFLSDFVPEKVKAEDALAQIPEAEK